MKKCYGYIGGNAMRQKCHGCSGVVDRPWTRGQLVFCSEKCRTESLNKGEPCEGWTYLGVGDEMVYTGTPIKVRAEP